VYLTKLQALERAATEGWSDTFLEQLIGKGGEDNGKRGMATFPVYRRNEDGQIVTAAPSYYQNLHEVIYASVQQPNEDGIPGRYYTVLHTDLDEAAHALKQLDYDHGKWPAHVIQREVLTDRLIDSRGLVELSATDQGLLKLFFDTYGDNAQLNGAPPVVTYGRKSMGDLYIEPLIELPAKRDGDYKWMQPPAFPATVDKMIGHLWRMVNQYHGRSAEDVPEDLVRIHREFDIYWWLVNVREILVLILQTCQQYMPDETIQRITDSIGNPILRSREEIQGQFDVYLAFDPNDFDPAHLETLAKTIKDLLLAMDKEQTIQTAPLIASLMWRLSPELAEESLRSVDKAKADEIKDEVQNYLMIRAGLQPPMVTDGSQNYAERLAFYQGALQADPEVFADMAENKRAILQARLEHLTAMAQQYGENVQIGRQGARSAPALEVPQEVSGA